VPVKVEQLHDDVFSDTASGGLRFWGLEANFLGAAPPPPQRLLQIQLGGLGERCKLPQWGPGRSPGRQRFWCISRAKDDPTLHDLLGIFEHQELASNATQRFITNRSTEVMLA